MNRLSPLSALTATFITLGITTGTVIPIVTSSVAIADTTTSTNTTTTTSVQFSDISNHWAAPFIQALASGSNPIIHGYGDKTFRPDQPVTRAEFASLIQSAFNNSQVQTARQGQFPFTDVANNYWAKSAIQQAYQTGFMSGYSSNQFHPEDKIPRVQALVSLASGLNLPIPSSTDITLRAYNDASSIPAYAVDKVAAATQKQMVVDYPKLNMLRPNQNATRGEVAAFIYQALVQAGTLTPISSSTDAAQYIVGNTPTTNGSSSSSQANTLKVDKGTQITVSYDQKYVIATPDDTVNLTLNVPSNVKNSQGTVVIPKDSQIDGQLVPRYSGSQFLGTQFVAQRLIIGSQSFSNINATSALINSTQQVGQVTQGTVQNAALTAAAQAIIVKTKGEQFDIGGILNSAGNILGGILNGSGSSNSQPNNVIIISPAKDLTLTVGSDFYIKQVN